MRTYKQNETDGLRTWPEFEKGMPFYVPLDVIIVEFKNCSDDEIQDEKSEGIEGAATWSIYQSDVDTAKLAKLGLSLGELALLNELVRNGTVKHVLSYEEIALRRLDLEDEKTKTREKEKKYPEDEQADEQVERLGEYEQEIYEKDRLILDLQNEIDLHREIVEK